MRRFFAVKVGDTLRPLDERGRDILAKIKDGKHGLIELRIPRNLRMHRLYWALVHKVFDNQSRYASTEALHNAIKLAVGHAIEITRPDTGEIAYIPQSIRFEAMDDNEFKEFFGRVVSLVCEHIIPNLEDEALRKEIEEMVGLRV